MVVVQQREAEEEEQVERKETQQEQQQASTNGRNWTNGMDGRTVPATEPAGLRIGYSK